MKLIIAVLIAVLAATMHGCGNEPVTQTKTVPVTQKKTPVVESRTVIGINDPVHGVFVGSIGKVVFVFRDQVGLGLEADWPELFRQLRRELPIEFFGEALTVQISFANQVNETHGVLVRGPEIEELRLSGVRTVALRSGDLKAKTEEVRRQGLRSRLAYATTLLSGQSRDVAIERLMTTPTPPNSFPFDTAKRIAERKNAMRLASQLR